MKNFLQRNLLVFALFTIPGNCIYAEENNDLNKFNFEKVSQQLPLAQTQTDTVNQIALIKNNLLYVQITAGMYVFTLIVIAFLMKITTHYAKDIVSIIGLVSVIFGTILLVLVVDTSETLTAPMGIFGAIAGYLFGAAQKKEVSNE